MLTNKLDPNMPFVSNSTLRHPIGMSVGDFWQWAFSDFASNVVRGILAEFLVGAALAVEHDGPRDAWADFDLVTPEGTRVEVKATGSVQAWPSRNSAPQFGGLRARALTPDRAAYIGDATVRADVFVFCYHTARTRAELDPTDISQWEFYVLPASVIDATGQKSIRLSRVCQMTPRLYYEQLKDAVVAAAQVASPGRPSRITG